MNEPMLSTLSSTAAAIFMKVGFHGAEDLPAILDRKAKEEAQAGHCLWGYGGTLLHPTTQLFPFLALCRKRSIVPIVCFIETMSAHESPQGSASEYSTDRVVWRPIPDGVQVSASRFAIALRRISPVEEGIDLSRYMVAVGPSSGRRASDYLRGRVDKVCALLGGAEALPAIVTVSYVAEWVEPFAVFLR